jgi:hypothetical protein
MYRVYSLRYIGMNPRSYKMAEKKYKLELASVLGALDRRDFNYYSKLTDEEKKGYVPVVLMRYMSSLTDQNTMAPIAVLAVNDLVNIGFWSLSGHDELLHKLLCLSGISGKQYRPWLATKKSKKPGNKIDEWILEKYPELNAQEISLIMRNLSADQFSKWIKDHGVDDKIVKLLLDEWKKRRDD